jgi:hypothetical protein
MLASVLGMALSIEFGIAMTYALGACFYVACAFMMVGSRQANPVKEPGWVRHDEVAFAADPAVPSICSTEIELVPHIEPAKSLGPTVPPTVRARADEVIE